MTGTKIAIAILILVAVIFVVLVFAGPSQADATPPANPDPQAYPSLASMNQVLAAFSPGLDTTQLRPSVAFFDLGATPSFAVTIGASSHSLRSAKFEIQPKQGTRCAHLVYNAFGQAPPGLESLKNQDPDAAKPSSNPFEISFAVLAGGGELSITREPGHPGPCTVALK
jgi:hypothetical protein